MRIAQQSVTYTALMDRNDDYEVNKVVTSAPKQKKLTVKPRTNCSNKTRTAGFIVRGVKISGFGWILEVWFTDGMQPTKMGRDAVVVPAVQ